MLKPSYHLLSRPNVSLNKPCVCQTLSHHSVKVLGNLKVTTNLNDLRQMDIVIEAATERLDIKQKLFVDLEKTVALSCILVTNTSTLTLNTVGESWLNDTFRFQRT